MIDSVNGPKAGMPYAVKLEVVSSTYEFCGSQQLEALLVVDRPAEISSKFLGGLRKGPADSQPLQMPGSCPRGLPVEDEIPLLGLQLAGNGKAHRKLREKGRFRL
jgi:hypothetical protein